MFSRAWDTCTPEVAEAGRKLQENFFVRFAPWQLVITRTAVSLDVQEAIEMQGRFPLARVNEARLAAGLWPILPAENHMVTWTAPRKSLHVVGSGIRDLSEAVDLAIAIDPDGPLGPLKPRIDWKNNRYPAMAVLAEALGFQAGINFHPSDPGHLQMRRTA